MRRFLNLRTLVVVLGMAVVALAGALFLRTGGSGTVSNSTASANSGPGTVFLYAVHPGSTQILTYSPVHGTVAAIGRPLSKVVTSDPDTQSGQVASCVEIKDDMPAAGADPAVLPYLSWTDLEGQDQQQFFNHGEVVYVCNHYLKTTPADNTVLVSLPTAK